MISLDFILIPYSFGMLYYFDMLFFNASQYAVKCLLPLMLITLVGTPEVWHKNASDVIFEVLFYGLTFVSTFSSGIYVFVTGLVPVFVILILNWISSNKDLIIHKDPVFIRNIRILLLTFFSVVVGFCLNKILGSVSYGSNMILISSEAFFDNLRRQIWGVFSIFGAIPEAGIKISDKVYLLYYFRIAFVFFLICILCVKTIQAIWGKLNLLDTMLLSVAWWNFFILSITNTMYGGAICESRYHLIGALAMLCLASEYVYEKMKEEKNSHLMLGVLLLFLLIFNVTSYKSFFDFEEKGTPNDLLKEVCEYANDNGLSRVYFMNDTAAPEVCRAIDIDRCVYLSINGSGVIWSYDYFEKYSSEPVEIDHGAVIASIEDWDFGDSVELFDHTYKKTEVFGKYVLYR